MLCLGYLSICICMVSGFKRMKFDGYCKILETLSSIKSGLKSF